VAECRVRAFSGVDGLVCGTKPPQRLAQTVEGLRSLPVLKRSSERILRGDPVTSPESMVTFFKERSRLAGHGPSSPNNSGGRTGK
jgi:hypothetical protein